MLHSSPPSLKSGHFGRRQTFFFVGCVLSACAEDVDLPEISWSGEDFDFGTESGYPFCGGTLKFQQSFVDLAQGLFGQPREGERFTFYQIYSETLADVCPPELSGCYRDKQVFSETAPNLHEVTHAVIDLAIGRTAPFFSEGIAEVFRDGLWSSASPGEAGVEEGLAFDGVHDALPRALYARAGHFMSYLLSVHGLEVTLEVLRKARPGERADDLKEDLESSIGLSFDEIIADYTSFPECRNSIYRWPITECSVPPISDRFGRWRINASVDCEREDVIGPRLAERWTVRTVEIETPGVYLITVDASAQDSVFVEFGHCSVGCAEDKGLRLPGGTKKLLALREGRYYLSFVGVGGAPFVSIAIEPAEEAALLVP